MKKLVIFAVILGLLSCSGNSNNEQASSKDNNTIPTSPKIDLKATVKSENTVEFLIETNIPLPVEFMASIDLKDQEPDEIYIGASKKIKVESTPFSLDFDINEYKLPSGEYNAEVAFYPGWGANNGNELAKEIKSEVVGSSSITLGTSYGTAEERKEMDKKQSWIMNNVFVGTPWNRDKFIKKLGEYQELIVTNRNPEIIKAYYFSEADMTIFVSKPKKSVITWREGKIDAL